MRNSAILIVLLIVLTSTNSQNKYDITLEYVYDGDTITADIEAYPGIILNDQKIRLYAINAPEVRGEERIEGLKSKQALIELLDNQNIQMIHHGKGKYGRTIGELYIQDTISVSNWMVRNGYAEYVKY